MKLQTLMGAAECVRKETASVVAGRGETLELVRVRFETDGIEHVGERTPTPLQAAACADIENLDGHTPEESLEHRHVTRTCPGIIIDETLKHADH